MRNTLLLALTVFVVASVGACAASDEVPLAVERTDFGLAVAESARHEGGHLAGVLESRDGERLHADAFYNADTQRLEMTVADTAVEVLDAMDLNDLALGSLNYLLFALWEIEVQAPSSTVCIQDERIECCRAARWTCQARPTVRR